MTLRAGCANSRLANSKNARLPQYMKKSPLLSRFPGSSLRIGAPGRKHEERPERIALERAFGATVRRLRLKAGISQERLALDVGRGRANTSALERGLY